MNIPELATPGARRLFARMRDKRVLVVGDVMLDEWVWGSVTRMNRCPSTHSPRKIAP